MATPTEKLAQSLEVLRQLQSKEGRNSIRAKDLSRTHRERLLEAGFIQEVIKGWYIPSRPDDVAGDSTAWFTSFWSFSSQYLDERFSKNWCVSPEQSILLHSGNWSVPKQLLIRSPKGNNNLTKLPNETSIFDGKLALPSKTEIATLQGVRLFTLPAALIACSENFFKKNPTYTRAALAMIKDSSDILTPLLGGGHTRAAGRLAGAFRNMGRERTSKDIVDSMKSAGYDVREADPFDDSLTIQLSINESSPYVHRIKLMWQEMRVPIISSFPKAPGLPNDIKEFMKQVEDIYKTDAYHSLSIEGYQVTEELIERVRSGEWGPEANEADKDNRNAMAARGYWQAYQVVKESIIKVLKGQVPGNVADEDHGAWYRELFSPSVTAGILKPGDLAGYRNTPVYIRNSKHVPLNVEAVRDAMPAFFNLLKSEEEPAVRAVLGHFIFVYIHPYIDGNGRVGRFLMNVMLTSGGYPWTVIPSEKRNSYMEALELASVEQHIEPFAKFISELVKGTLKGKHLKGTKES